MFEFIRDVVDLAGYALYKVSVCVSAARRRQYQPRLRLYQLRLSDGEQVHVSRLRFFLSQRVVKSMVVLLPICQEHDAKRKAKRALCMRPAPLRRNIR